MGRGGNALGGTGRPYGGEPRMFETELIYALTANDRVSEALELLSQQEYEPQRFVWPWRIA